MACEVAKEEVSVQTEGGMVGSFNSGGDANVRKVMGTTFDEHFAHATSSSEDGKFCYHEVLWDLKREIR